MRRIVALFVIAVVAANPASAAFRGANGRLATHAGERLWTYAPDGTRPRSLDIRGARFPEWSPDGRWLVFVRDQDIAKVRSDGSGFRWLTNDAQEQRDPGWSPDGHHIVYVEETDIFKDDIFVMRADGSNVRRLTTNGAGKREPAWAPDGRKIAFVQCPAVMGTDQYAPCFGARFPSITGPGGSITPTVDASPRDVYLMNTDGTDGERVVETLASEWTLDWSPDSTRIVTGCGQNDVCMIDVAGGTSAAVYSGDLAARGATWSPNGRWIAFAARPPEEDDQELFKIRPDGSDLTRLTYNGHKDLAPDWGPR